MAARFNIRPRIFCLLPWAEKQILARYAIVLATVITSYFLGQPAHAQTYCGVRESVLAKLDTTYDEQPVANGLASSGNLIELLISTNGTWTILVTRPTGVTCVVAVGRDWNELRRLLPGGST